MINKSSGCNYVMSGLSSYVNHCESVLNTHKEYFPGNSLNDLILNNVDKFLTSFGMSLIKGEKVDASLNKRFREKFQRSISKPYLNGVEHTIDSSGYQVQQGFIAKEDTSALIKYYHEMLLEINKDISWAFPLDICPGESLCIYNSWEEIKKYNVESLKESAKLPEDLRKKMLYIYQFRTPKMNEVWKQLTFEEGLAEPFENFSVGGMVSFANNANPTINLYTIPLIYILDYAKKRGLKKFRFHVLGGSNFSDIIFHKFIEHHIKKIHNIDCEITYDSSSVFQILAMARTIIIPDKQNRSLMKMSIKSNMNSSSDSEWGSGKYNTESKSDYIGNDRKISDILYDAINNSNVPYGMKKLTPEIDPIYLESGMMNKIIYQYGLNHLLTVFKYVDNLGKELVKELYPIYEQEKNDQFAGDFHRLYNNILIRLNGLTSSKKLANKSSMVFNSLKEIENLDTNKADYFIKEYLGHDEIESLDSNHISKNILLLGDKDIDIAKRNKRNVFRTNVENEEYK